MAGTRSRRISSPVGGIGSPEVRDDVADDSVDSALLHEGGASALVADHRQTSGEAERDPARDASAAFDRSGDRFGIGVDHLDQPGTAAGYDSDIHGRAV